MKSIFWVVSNIYGKVFGWAFLAPIHHAVISLSLHGLGYGNMYRESWTGEEWFVKKILAPLKPKIILDIGANVGNYSKMLIDNTNAKVFAFEPSSSSFAKLLEQDERIIKINTAVADYEGEAELNSKIACDGKASLDKNIRSGHAEKVKVTTIKSFIESQKITNVDFVKIDTEGFEREVVRGLGSIRPRFIQMEFNINHLQRNCTFLEIATLLPEYDFYRLLPNGWLKIDPEKYLSNIFIFSNVIAVCRNSQVN
jgi:FkbM family methyltransferase